MNIFLSDLSNKFHNKFASVMVSILIELRWQTNFWVSWFLQIHGGEEPTNKAYLLTLGGAQWTAKGSMAEERRGPACGVVRNWATDKEEVVAAAGYKPWVMEVIYVGVQDDTSPR